MINAVHCLCLGLDLILHNRTLELDFKNHVFNDSLFLKEGDAINLSRSPRTLIAKFS